MEKRFILFCLLVVISFGLYAKVPRCKNVILIGADGMTSQIFKDYPGRYKNIEALMKKGCWTLSSRSVLPSSSAINWASVFMGMGTEMHGYTEWNSSKPDFTASEMSHWGVPPTIFGEIRDQKPEYETGAIYSWNGIENVIGAKSINYVLYTKHDDDKEVLDKSLEYIKSKKPNMLFIYFSDPDVTGHNSGWLSEKYYSICDSIDKYVGVVVDAVNSSMDPKKTAIIFTSDHGGINKGHGGKTLIEMETPFIVVNPSLPQNYEIKYSVMRYDTAPTIAHLLGIKSPDVWRGKSVLRNIDK